MPQALCSKHHYSGAACRYVEQHRGSEWTQICKDYSVYSRLTRISETLSLWENHPLERTGWGFRSSPYQIMNDWRVQSIKLQQAVHGWLTSVRWCLAQGKGSRRGPASDSRQWSYQGCRSLDNRSKVAGMPRQWLLENTQIAPTTQIHRSSSLAHGAQVSCSARKGTGSIYPAACT